MSVATELVIVAAQLVDVRTAIEKCLEAQSYGDGGHDVDRAKLSELTAREKSLIARQSQLSAGSGGSRTAFARRGY